MAVTRDDVVRVAHLARLELDETRVPDLVGQLNGILAHMEVLQQVDTTRVCAVAGVGDEAMPLREDAGPPIPLQRPIEALAPAVRDGFFIVPRLGTHERAAEVPEDHP
jgi:aspartyl-tRNA(Asn)/glutamyl-tRNA(Gln) amidotransferase subunit C